MVFLIYSLFQARSRGPASTLTMFSTDKICSMDGKPLKDKGATTLEIKDEGFENAYAERICEADINTDR